MKLYSLPERPLFVAPEESISTKVGEQISLKAAADRFLFLFVWIERNLY